MDTIKVKGYRGERGLPLFDGFRYQFRDCFFSNADDGAIVRWCMDMGYKYLKINGELINFNEWYIPT